MSKDAHDLDRIVDLIAGRVEAELRRAPAMPWRATGTLAVQSVPCSTCKVAGACDAETVVANLNDGATRVGTVGAIGGAPCTHVAPLIDHTLLLPEATRDEIAKLCEEARQYGFATVCVNSVHVPFAASCLDGSPVKPIAVVGFPLGAASSASKAFEAREAVRNGAQEIDMVLNIGALKARDHALVFEDIQRVVTGSKPAAVKVILETSKHDRDEKLMACALAKAAGAAFVKTSTGFGGGGATPEDVAIMRSAVGPDMGVKASGGVRTIDDAEKVIAAGATRIGASASVAIVRGERSGRPGGAY